MTRVATGDTLLAIAWLTVSGPIRSGALHAIVRSWAHCVFAESVNDHFCWYPIYRVNFCITLHMYK